MTAKMIGHVVHIKGSVEVRTPEGIVKILNVGDPVHEGDVIITAAGTEVEIEFFSGKMLDIGGSVEVLLDETVFRDQEFDNSEVIAEVATLQQAILDGTLDISDLEPTAAGPLRAVDTDGAGEAVVYDRDGREGVVDAQTAAVTTTDDTVAVSSTNVPLDETDTSQPTSSTSETTNDSATVSSSSVGLAETDTPVSTSGTLTSSDPAGAFAPATIVGTIGTFAIDAAGAWTLQRTVRLTV